MTIEYIEGDIFASGAQTLVNPVNTEGVMGSGLAAQFKHRYPMMFQRYERLCKDRLLKPGNLHLWKGPGEWVLNFPTKEQWRQPSRIEWIEAGLRKFVATYESRGISHVAFPRLGCGHGGLPWEDVRDVMEDMLGPLPIRVLVTSRAEQSRP